VAFSTESITSINSYGYSPHSLTNYLGWVETILTSHPSSTKPVIISITNSDPVVLQSMVRCIQELRSKLHDTNPGKPGKSRIAIELNTSCPNISNSPPSGYSFKSLLPLLHVLKNAFAQDMTLTIGLKLPPYVSRDQFTEVINTLQSLVISNANETPKSPFSFLTCTNTLGNSLLFSNQTTTNSVALTFAVPTTLGGVAGETLHPLALGNVFTFKQLLSSNEAITAGLGNVRIIGVGGVTSKEAVVRMRQAGADVVGCATLLGKEGVQAFEILSKT
jgi:dihydroorotate dehydrogenase (fumarate)